MSPRATETMSTLIALNGVVKPAMFELDDLCTIGRDPKCHIFVDSADRVVSRVHAKVERSGPRYVLSDMASTNGTYLNGQRLRGPCRLSDQDYIGLGSKVAVLRFEDHDRTELTTNQDWLDYDETNMWFYLFNQRVELPIQQFRLLLHLYRHAGEPCTREQCAAIVWAEEFTPSQLANLDEVIRKLRENVCGAVPAEIEARSQVLRDVREKMITTRRGIGFVLYLHPNDADAQSGQRR